VKTGSDVLVAKRASLVQGKKIGLVTNHSAVLKDGRHLADALQSIPGTKIRVIFAPEHGFRGDAPDGETVRDGLDPKTGARIISLFGDVKKPTREMLKDVDLIIFDIQDVGARFYTFTSTLFLTMEAAAEYDIPYLVLDRPNPINGLKVEGPVLEKALSSFIGLYEIPVRHGMTVGELARLINGEGWMNDGVEAGLEVIPMEGWTRALYFDETSLPWIKPSPNIATVETAVVYPGLCFVEGTNLSEGRGTDHPFEMIGAPYIRGAELAEKLNSCSLAGVRFEPADFTPRDILRVTSDPKYESTPCQGVFLRVTDRQAFEPLRTAVYLLSALKQLYPADFQWRSPFRSEAPYYIDLLAGTKSLRQALDGNENPEEIISSWVPGLRKFRHLRQKYLLY
jgi:uncharacterized protein YbbC (DUF1343 family)